MPSAYDDALNAAHAAAKDFHASLGKRGVLASEEAIARLQEFHTPLPEIPSSDKAVIELLHGWGSPAAVATTGGRFFGFVIGGALPAAVGANWLATAWDQNAGSWMLSPVAAELETVAAAWILEILDLPRDAAVGFVTGSTMGTFSAFAAARSALLRRRGWDVKECGLNGAPRIKVVVSEETHPTNLRALGYVGFGLRDIVRAPVDDNGRVIAELLPELDDLTLLVIQAGNINSGSFDPFAAICRKARDVGAWVHVDGAFGLWARASASKRYLTEGIEMADSWSVDGHKWLNLPQDSAVYVCRDGGAVHDVFGVRATYLIESEGRRQPATFTPELSRRARGVDFWAAFKRLGRSGIAAIVDRSCAYASMFERGLRNHGFEVLNEVELNQVVFVDGDEATTQGTLSRIQNSGVLWLGPTTWKGRLAMRLNLTSWATTEHDVRISLEAIGAARAASQRP